MHSVVMESLAVEVLFLIADYLDVDTVINLRSVSKRLYLCFSQETYWKQRLLKQDVIFLRRYFSNRYRQAAYFTSNYEKELANFTHLIEPISVQAHHGTADAVRLINNAQQCVSGARNYSLNLWDLNTDQSISKLYEVKQAHLGWIWSVDKDFQGRILSSGFDHFLKRWKMTESGLKLAGEICMGSPVLLSRSTSDMLYVSTCNSKVTILDQHNLLECVSTLKYHKKPAIDVVVTNSPYVYTLSEDELAFVDSRMWSKFKSFRWKTPCYSIAKCGDLLYVSRSDESRQHSIIQIIDTVTSNLLNEFNLSNASRCRLSAGKATIACLGSNLNVFSGGIKPKQIWSCENTMEKPINLDYKSGRLAVTSSNGQLTCFFPESQ